MQLGCVGKPGCRHGACFGLAGSRVTTDGTGRASRLGGQILVKGSLKNPYLVVIGALTVFLLGAVALSRIPTDILPTFRTPAVQILTLYPGMPAETMERDITSRLERWTGQSTRIALHRPRCRTGDSV